MKRKLIVGDVTVGGIPKDPEPEPKTVLQHTRPDDPEWQSFGQHFGAQGPQGFTGETSGGSSGQPTMMFRVLPGTPIPESVSPHRCNTCNVSFENRPLLLAHLDLAHQNRHVYTGPMPPPLTEQSETFDNQGRVIAIRIVHRDVETNPPHHSTVHEIVSCYSRNPETQAVTLIEETQTVYTLPPPHQSSQSYAHAMDCMCPDCRAVRGLHFAARTSAPILDCNCASCRGARVREMNTNPKPSILRGVYNWARRIQGRRSVTLDG